MISRAEATRNALAKGGTLEEIERQAAHYERQVKSVPFNNMIRALNLHPWLNDVNDWTRLAAALTARGRRRGKTR